MGTQPNLPLAVPGGRRPSSLGATRRQGMRIGERTGSTRILVGRGRSFGPVCRRPGRGCVSAVASSGLPNFIASPRPRIHRCCCPYRHAEASPIIRHRVPLHAVARGTPGSLRLIEIYCPAAILEMRQRMNTDNPQPERFPGTGADAATHAMPRRSRQQLLPDAQASERTRLFAAGLTTLIEAGIGKPGHVRDGQSTHADHHDGGYAPTPSTRPGELETEEAAC